MLDQLGGAVVHERRRFGLAHLRDRALGQRVAVVGAVRHDVEQHHRHAGIGDLGGDARPHHAGADDADFLDRMAGHHTRSRIVAMPWPPPMHWLASA